jgi:hypothetical protein
LQRQGRARGVGRRSRRPLDEARRVVEGAALELVSSERFQTMAHALASVLHEERYIGSFAIEKILDEAEEALRKLAWGPVEA